jgi:hypothetical protein
MGNVLDRLPGREVCLIMDESLKQGNERLLLLVVTPWNKQSKGSLGYKDTMVCYLGGRASWTGEKIREVAEKVAREANLEIKGVLSDEDGKLLKAARLMDIPHLPDIGHAVASCLRKTFEKDSRYEALVKLITSLQARAVNQDLSHLRPPKQRVKARFMNQKGFVDWGLAMLNKFSQLNEKEKAFFDGLHTDRPMLETLSECIGIGEKVAKVFKAGGLSKASAEQAELLTGTLKGKEGLTKLFLGHLQSYLDRYISFLAGRDGVFNASSDIIESMFGRNKNTGTSDSLVGVPQMDLEMAVYCLGEEDLPRFAKAGLESVFTSDLKKWRIDHSSGNQAIRRKKLFAN